MIAMQLTKEELGVILTALRTSIEAGELYVKAGFVSQDLQDKVIAASNPIIFKIEQELGE